MAFAHISIHVLLALGFSQIATAASTKHVTCPSGNITANAACCALFPAVDLLQEQLFDRGKCGEQAHSALRLAFHDAIGFSVHGGKGGGADGSILAFQSSELQYRTSPFQKTDKLIHLAAAVGTANCPGSPRLQFKFGRPPPRAPAPDLTVPEPTDSVTAILERFADAGFLPREAVALLSSHSVAAADEVDPTVPGSPFDSTPGTFDSQVFLEVLLKGKHFPGNGSHVGEVASPLAGEMRLQSDFAISQHPLTACSWQEMVNNQHHMQTQFKAAMAKLQVLGQPSNLIDCSDVIPVPAPLKAAIKYPASFSKKDVQIACDLLSFPDIATVPGPAPTVSPVST
ncbi:hypothetical protein NLJ89_g10309 [Agrocybe chaxingu]|uniref:Peroxidase n=1 Tax=Agrocybe chaxingu TaxID=84603 RepID=A0A9W8JYY1_9AGAR|nr:hypothetical protein NLJ89_g10309 [Agrocybe chaxingu]